MSDNKSKFNQNFIDNKKALEQITIIRSKGLKNEIAGYITKYIKHEIYDNKIKHAQQDIVPQDKTEQSTDASDSAMPIPETPTESESTIEHAQMSESDSVDKI